MKKLLSLFCVLVALSGCSTFGVDGGLFSGADCESRLARDFVENTTDTVFFAFDSSALSAEAQAALDTQVAWLKKHDDVNVKATAMTEVLVNTTWLWANAVPML